MNTPVKILTLVAAAGGVVVTAWFLRDTTPQRLAPAGEPTVTIRGRTWTVELALTAQQQYRGLSFRTHLAESRGMLFIFPRSAEREFCMRDCEIPLDIAFLDANRIVTTIHTMAVEADRVGSVPYRSRGEAQFALEVSAGALRRAGVRVGDRVTFSSAVPDP